jgi:CheY-like chemotaxis protein
MTLPTRSTVLVVDDDDINRAILTDMLESLGVAQVHTASNGKEALRLLKKSASLPDCIVLDLFMPEMDGIEFIGHLRPLGYKGAVILMSAAAGDVFDVARTMATGAGLDLRATLIKPVDPEALAQALA